MNQPSTIHIGTAHRAQHGFTLVELLVGVTLGIIVMFAVTSFMANTLGANRANLTMTHLNQELRATLTMLTRELTRSGNWASASELALVTSNTDLILTTTSGSPDANAKIPGETGSSNADIPDHFGADNAFNTTLLGGKLTGTVLKYVDVDYSTTPPTPTVYTATVTYKNPTTLTLSNLSPATFPTDTLAANTWTILNPFTAGAIAIADGVDADNAADDCLLIDYDRPDEGTRGVLDNTSPNTDDQIGIRFDETAGTVEIRAGGADCMAGGWTDLTDPDTVEITDFTITDISPAAIAGVSAGYTLSMHEYQVTISGRLRANTAVQRTIQRTFKLRNNQVL